jgi:hypothetical protein
MDEITLRQKQSLFVQLFGKLIEFAYANGYELTFGEAYRTPEQALLNARKGLGIKNSVHTERCAVDVNLFKDGQYQAHAWQHKPLGDYWKTLHPDCRWGGDFKIQDGNHYSITPDGVRA